MPAAEAFDAYLVTGGLPLILDEWPHSASRTDYLTDAVTDSTSALLVSAERALAAEFPTGAQAPGPGRDRLGRTNLHADRGAAGDLPQASLSRALHLLTTKRKVDASTPLSTQASKETRYVVADPYLRFWLTFLGP